MGARKRLKAEARKEANKSIAFAKLNNSPITPRKMRLVADLVRGEEVNKALNILQHNAKDASTSLGKLLRSAIARIQPAPQGRAHRIRKRSNHVTIVVDAKNAE